MSGLAGYLTVNRNMQLGDAGPRDYRLPRTPAFPKLDRSAVVAAKHVPSLKTESTGQRLHVRMTDAGPLPEMTTELIGAADCTRTVNRRRSAGQPNWAGWVRRVLGDW